MVIDRVPAFQRGLEAVLQSAGYAVDHPRAVLPWVRAAGLRCALVDIGAREWDGLARVAREGAALRLIGVVEEWTGQARTALLSGAHGVFDRGAAVDVLPHVVELAIQGHVYLPLATTTRLLQRATEPPSWLSPDDAALLRQLAHGASVAELARQSSRSTRDTYRVVQRLLRKMGVCSRSHAAALFGSWFPQSVLPPASR